MNLAHILLTALAAFVAYFIFGGVVFMGVPALKREFEKHSALYRPHDDLMKVMPLGMAATFVAILVLVHIYVMIQGHGSVLQRGLIFGGMIGVFFDCVFVVHNHVNLKVSAKLSIQQGVAYFFEWLVVGIVIALVYGNQGT